MADRRGSGSSYKTHLKFLISSDNDAAEISRFASERIRPCAEKNRIALQACVLIEGHIIVVNPIRIQKAAVECLLLTAGEDSNDILFLVSAIEEF